MEKPLLIGECPASVSDQRVQEAVSFKSVRKSVKQECPTRMSHKSVSQGCPIQEFPNVGAFGFVGSTSSRFHSYLYGNMERKIRRTCGEGGFAKGFCKKASLPGPPLERLGGPSLWLPRRPCSL